MSDHPAYLPPGIADALRVGFRDLTTDHLWKIARLAERAFAQGYQDGYVRGFDDGYRHGAAEAKADGDDQ